MKHHKHKGVWSHRPDALPLPDAPSTGTKRKKGPLARLSKKHLWDRVKQSNKEMGVAMDRLFIRGMPDGTNDWDCLSADWGLETVIKMADTMDGLIKALEGRMD